MGSELSSEEFENRYDIDLELSEHIKNMAASDFFKILTEAQQHGILDQADYKSKFDLIAGLPKFETEQKKFLLQNFR